MAPSKQRHRDNGATQALFVLPLFFVYQFGILTSHVKNGADLVTELLVRLCRHDFARYVIVLCLLLGLYVGVIWFLNRRGRMDVGRFGPLLGEAGIFALLMGTVIVFVMTHLFSFSPGLRVRGLEPAPSAVSVLAMSAGAGLHEELIFRLIGTGGLSWIFRLALRPWSAVVVSVLLSSLAFSAAHHLGPLGEPFTINAFVYRSLAGVYFALIYRWRGFSVAAWTHALYDLYFLTVVG